MGYIEPHLPLLKLPEQNQLLYKVMTIENLISSILGGYLYFNRVNSYRDFINADLSDGEQLPLDRDGNSSSKFEKAPAFSAADYYDNSRNRTYACCFSLENTNYIWKNYGKNGKKGKVCVVFDFQKLRDSLNKSLESNNASLIYNGNVCKQIFDINYGIVEYVNRSKLQINTKFLPRPIQYTYLKDARFKKEKELRISLSTRGTGQFLLNNGCQIEFPPSLFMGFDFLTAFKNKTIKAILSTKGGEFLPSELNSIFRIGHI